MSAAEGWGVDGLVRAYFESGYASSTGALSSTEPVAEQYIYLKGYSPYGYLVTDAWIFSTLTDQRDASHRRAFNCYEGSFLYGYDIPFGETVQLKSAVGCLWDWLGGYRIPHTTPIAWYFYQSLENPYVTPYWNGLGGGINTGSQDWVRMRGGLRRTFHPSENLSIQPYAEILWVSALQYRRLYGETPHDGVFRGAFPSVMPGVVTEWKFTSNWSVWFRYRHFFLIEKQARDSVKARGRETDKHHIPLFGLGFVYRF